MKISKVILMFFMLMFFSASISAAQGKFEIDDRGVSGWSYGGHMTAWLTGNYNDWKVAVAGAAVTDLRDQYTLSDGNVSVKDRFGSPYLKDQKFYDDQSPISYAHNVKAPTLILAYTFDPRVPVSQSYKLFHALKDNGVTTKYIAWPLAAHNAHDPVRQRETYKYWIDWIDHYIGDEKNASASVNADK